MGERNELPQLPKGWLQTVVGEVAQLLHGVSYDKQEALKEPRKSFIPVLRANNIQGELNFDDLVYVPPARVKEEQFIRAHDILIAMSSGSKDLVGKAAQAKQDFFGGFGTFCGLVRSSSEIDKRFVGYFFQSPYYRQEVSRLSSGVNINNLRREHVEAMPIPLASLPEQHRIVTKIEELFSDLDAGVAALRKTQAELKRYRQAVLKAAVEGKFTAEWRAANVGKVESAERLLERIRAERAKSSKGAEARGSKGEINAAELPALPEGWVWASVETIGEVSGGLTKNQKRNNLPLKMPYLRVANVYAGQLQLDEIKTIGVQKSEVEKLLLRKGDLLVVEGNGSQDQIGRVALWNGSISPCLHQNHIIKVRIDPSEVSKFVLLWLLSVEGRKQIVANSSSTSGLYTLSISKVSSLPVPVAPLAEQQQIVAEVERRLSVADAVEKTVDASLKQAEHLRQSILKRAFAGKLVPQDPGDESAERLLERIRAEREKHDQTETKTPRAKRK